VERRVNEQLLMKRGRGGPVFDLAGGWLQHSKEYFCGPPTSAGLI